jgi:hypothetical protein
MSQRLAVPFLQHQADVDVLLQGADPELLAAGRDEHADRRERSAGGVRVHFAVVNAEHAAVGEDRHHKL